MFFQTALRMINFLVNDPEQTAWIAAAAGGNPLPIEECAKSLTMGPPKIPAAVAQIVSERSKRPVKTSA
jgi:hypothetical protein